MAQVGIQTVEAHQTCPVLLRPHHTRMRTTPVQSAMLLIWPCMNCLLFRTMLTNLLTPLPGVVWVQCPRQMPISTSVSRVRQHKQSLHHLKSGSWACSNHHELLRFPKGDQRTLQHLLHVLLLMHHLPPCKVWNYAQDRILSSSKHHRVSIYGS
jgi:hypothetical protein